MSALGHYIESNGIATTGISLIREHTEQMRPPRALWVPFPLGRPLGVPADPEFQHRVLRAALSLLERTGPAVLEDFPHDAPTVPAAEETTWSCPVSFARAGAGDFEGQVREEMAQLAPWYELSLRRRGRTTIGVSAMSIDDALALIARCLRAEESHDDPAGRTLRAAIEDLKGFYLEAITAQPGAGVSAERVADVLWNETALSRLMRALEARGRHSVNAEVRRICAEMLIPRAHQHVRGEDSERHAKEGTA